MSKTVTENAAVDSEESAWLQNLRQNAQILLQQAPFPDSSMESWRKISLKNLAVDDFKDIGKSPLDTIQLQKTHGMDGVYIEDLRNLDNKSQGYIRERFAALLEKYKNDYFALYALAHFSQGIYIQAADNVVVQNQIALHFNMQTGANFLSTLVFVHVGKFSKMDILEHTTTETEKNALAVAFSDFNLQESASVTLSEINEFHSALAHFKTVHIQQKKDSHVSGFHFHTGGLKGKTFYHSELAGSGAGLVLNGIAELSHRQFNDIEMKASHLQDNTSSRILFKTILAGKSHNVFTGNLYIPENKKHIVASQTNHNLLVEKTARAESIPALEVFSQDVQCHHGATVGELDEELVFYLNSRGLDELEAKSIIIGAFLLSILDEHPAGDSVTIIKKILEKKGYYL